MKSREPIPGIPLDHAITTRSADKKDLVMQISSLISKRLSSCICWYYIHIATYIHIIKHFKCTCTQSTLKLCPISHLSLHDITQQLSVFTQLSSSTLKFDNFPHLITSDLHISCTLQPLCNNLLHSVLNGPVSLLPNCRHI